MKLESSDLLKYAVANGIIDLQCVRQQVEMKRRYEILSQHPYEIVFNEKRGRWFTRFKVNGKYVQRHRDTRAELEDLVINFYQTRSTCTGDVHPEEEEEVQKEKKLPKVSRKSAPVIPKKIPRNNPKSRERLIKELQIEAEKAAEEDARQEAERLKKEEEKEREKAVYPFDKAHDRWLEVQEEYGKDSNTIYRYERDWSRFFACTKFAKMDIRTMTSKDIEVFVIDRIKTLNLKRQAAVDFYGYISGVFYTAVVDRKISKYENPCDYVDKKKFKRYYNRSSKRRDQRVMTIEEIQKLVERMNYDISERPTCLSPYGVRLALLTGMRSGEICGLRWCSVYDDCVEICEAEKYVQHDKTYIMSDTKTSKERTMPMTDELRAFFDDMRKFQEKYGCMDDFVISTATDKLHGRRLSDYMIKASKKLGFNSTKTVHTIRRTFNSFMRSEGTSAFIAGSIIGNSAEVNTNHYSYDVCEMEEKKGLVSGVEKKMLANVKFA